MGSVFPPGVDEQGFARTLAVIPKRHREDAIQEAWLAHLAGRDPISAMMVYANREKRLERRYSPIPENEDGEDLLTQKDGQRRPKNLAASRQSKSLAPQSGHNSLAKAV